jgi:hypothetical protein
MNRLKLVVFVPENVASMDCATFLDNSRELRYGVRPGVGR